MKVSICGISHVLVSFEQSVEYIEKPYSNQELPATEIKEYLKGFTRSSGIVADLSETIPIMDACTLDILDKQYSIYFTAIDYVNKRAEFQVLGVTK